jgi:tRNA G18 (ribose-2'-O)-methylase SpoU
MSYKFTNQKTFKINDNIEIECKRQNTNYGFRHVATLFKNDHELNMVKCCYYNRTWESFEFESVIHKLANKAKNLTEDEKQQIMNFDNTENELKPLKMLSAIMQMTDLFNDDIKQKNDSKLRMLKAQMGEALILPDDWENLDEQIKSQRLNKIQNMLAE